MSRYLETAGKLRDEVVSFVQEYLVKRGDLDRTDINDAAVALGHIVNLAVRCNPRQSQGTVRKNIVETALRDFCRVTMTREQDEDSGREYNKIHIEPKLHRP